MVNKKFPLISFLLPTLNAGRVINNCLKSIFYQKYPQEKIEVIVADAGSTDSTLSIISQYQKSSSKIKIKVYQNPLKTGETGKAVALRHAGGELMVLIDSDNLLPSRSWLKKMIEPFWDKEIIGSEPWEFTYRKTDSFINRYCALIGVNDPYCYFVGNYDKKSILSGKWTGLEMEQEDKGKYLKVKIQGKILPTIGANGTIWKKDVLKKAIGTADYLFDTEVPYFLTKEKPFYFAKVKIGIIHLYCQSLSDFYRKQKRRAKDFFYLEKNRQRSSTYQKQVSKQVYFICSTLLVAPLFFQTFKGFLRKSDRAWFFHPLVCWITLWLYATETVLAQFKLTKITRNDWRQ